MPDIGNAAVGFIDATHSNNESDIMTAEMARDCFQRGYFGKTVERYGFLYENGKERLLSLHADSDEAYLTRAERELAGCATTDVVGVQRYIADVQADEAMVETALSQEAREQLDMDFDDSFFARARTLPRQRFLGHEEIDVVRRTHMGAMDVEGTGVVLSCGSIMQRSYGAKMIVENGCLSDFVRAIEKEFGQSSRLLEVRFERVSLSNRSIAQAHRMAKQMLLERSERYRAVPQMAGSRIIDEPMSAAAKKRLTCYAREAESF